MPLHLRFLFLLSWWWILLAENVHSWDLELEYFKVTTWNGVFRFIRSGKQALYNITMLIWLRPCPMLSLSSCLWNCFQFHREHSQDQHTLMFKPYLFHLPLLYWHENRSSFFKIFFLNIWGGFNSFSPVLGTSRGELCSWEGMNVLSHTAHESWT